MNTVARLLPVICTVVISGVFAADPVASESDEPPSQPAVVTPPQPVAQSPTVAPTGPGAMKAAPPDPASSGKPDTAAQPVANKPERKVLVDNTVTDAQLKQILNKGYKPEGQARGNEVYYCRSERELGTRFERKICRTAARILEEEQQGKEETATLEKTGGNKLTK
jgi:hypothetical protein